MPELPEVETVRTLIRNHVINQSIAGVSLGAFTGVLESTLLADPRELLIGATILDARRRGKYLLFPLSNDLWMTIHLRMTGRLIAKVAADPPIRFEHAAIHLASGEDLRFGDQRKFGRITVSDESAIDALAARLGPEPFDRTLTSAWLLERLARRTGNIKSALLDQSLIAGLGNIYVDEALWHARIHPLRPSNTVTRDELQRLIRAIRNVLQTSIANQGTTFSTFENPYGEAGANASYSKVYGRTKTAGACERCGTPLERLVVSGRGTTFCPRCQSLAPLVSTPAGHFGNEDPIVAGPGENEEANAPPFHPKKPGVAG